VSRSAFPRCHRLALALPALAAFAVPVMRWNANGHMTIAAIAWNHMTPASRSRAVQLLRNGPPLAQFSELESPGAGDDRDRQLFLAASTWADRVRANNIPSHVYNHGTWHYTDYFWRENNGHVEAVPGLAPDAENALERLPLLETALASAAADTTRAIALAWILHLVGDVHQPLHLSARVTPAEPQGDKGGNTFRLQGQPNNLHAYWDGAVDLVEPASGAGPVAYADRLAQRVEQDVPVNAIAPALVSATFDVWGRESLDIAQREVYASTLHPGDAPSAVYAQNAAKIAERRVALAGYRLASLLNRVLATPGTEVRGASGGANGSQAALQGADALRAIVGVWQSDTTSGNSALSNCAWTPAHGAVLCEQDITTPTGKLHAFNLFTFDPAAGTYVFYVLGHPGDPMRPVPLTIKGAIWIYGGQMAGPDGRKNRTVNDFSGSDSYSWRQESNLNGDVWTMVAGGRSRRVR
jgi:hypothetical protein